MKKLVAIFALFSMMVLTSFASPNDVGGKGMSGSKGDPFTNTYSVGGKGGMTNSRGDIFNNNTSMEVGGKGMTNSSGDK